jgi:type I restriction enzyme S subunit
LSAVLEAREPSVRHLAEVQPALVQRFELLATAPGGVARLRELILTLAVQGKLASQNPNDESADDLLKRIRGERERLTALGEKKRDKLQLELVDNDPAFALPIGWAWAPLQQLGYTQTGSTPDAKTSAFFGTHIPFLKPGDIYPSYVEYENEGLSVAGLEASSRQAPAGSALMVCIGTIGKCAVIDRDCSFNQQINAITPIFVVPDYLGWCLRSPYFQSEARARTSSTTIAILNKGKWEAIPVPVPPLAEQARIVSRVDELMRLCDALEANGRLEAEQHARLLGTLLGTLTDSSTPDELAANWQRVADHFDLLLDRPEAVDALEQTVLQLAVRGLLVPQDPSDVSAETLIQDIRAEKDRMIADGRIKRDKPLPPIAADEKPFELPSGWACVTLDSLASQITDGAHHTPNYVQAGVPFLSVKDLSSGVIDFSDTRFISSEAHRDLAKRCNPEFGDLLLTKIGTTGIAVVVDTTVPFSLFVSVALIKLPPISARQDYLALVINSPFVRQQSEDGTEGVGNKNLVLRKIRAFRIPLPPLGEQSRIVARVEELRRLCSDLRQRLTTSQTTRSRLAEALIAEVA